MSLGSKLHQRSSSSYQHFFHHQLIMKIATSSHLTTSTIHIVLCHLLIISYIMIQATDANPTIVTSKRTNNNNNNAAASIVINSDDESIGNVIHKNKHKASASKQYDYTMYEESDPRYWYTMAAAELRERVDILRPIHRQAKNVVLFLGDGMGLSTITAARILKGQLQGQRGEEGYLEFDRFPYTALIKTYNLDKQVPDSAGTATAYLTGVKANFYTVGVSAKVNKDTVDCSLVRNSSVSSFIAWALEAGKAAGIVTTTRITHATPAGTYAHIQNRDWEAELPSNGMLQNAHQCKDIARQLIEDFPGNRLNVILGGGRGYFIPRGTLDPKGTRKKGQLLPVEGVRKDGRNLIREWCQHKEKQLGLAEGKEYRYVNSSKTLREAMNDVTSGRNKLKYLFGLFNHTNMEYEQLRDRTTDGEPSLTEMTEAAIRVLTNQPNDNGFVLLVEGGRIDHAHHDGYSNLALYETVELDRAIRRARELLPMDETLILVTADHSHAMTINGYPKRGNPIWGFANSDDTGVPFTTLMYANGPGHRNEAQREMLITEDLAYLKFRPHSGVKVKETFHGGEDVAVFGSGPMAHFFGGTHEQSYIAHVVGYAACIGVYRNETHCTTQNVLKQQGGETTNKVTENENDIETDVDTTSLRSSIVHHTNQPSEDDDDDEKNTKMKDTTKIQQQQRLKQQQTKSMKLTNSAVSTATTITIITSVGFYFFNSIVLDQLLYN